MQYEFELIKLHKGLPFKAYFVSIGFRGYHWHSETEVMCVLKGSVQLQSRQGDVLLKEGDIYILNTYEIHSLKSTSEDNLLLGIQLSEHLLKGIFHPLNTLYFLENHLVANDPRTTLARKYMFQTMAQVCHASQTHLIKAQGFLYQLLAFFMDHLAYQVQDQNNKLLKAHDVDRITRILEYINVNFSHTITLEQIAQLQAISRYHLSHFIKDKLGINFQQLVNHIRLEHAIILLTSTDKTIQSISEVCGFSDVKYLNQMIKKTYNLTAKQFRQRSQENYTTTYENGEIGHRQVNAMEALSIINHYIMEDY